MSMPQGNTIITIMCFLKLEKIYYLSQKKRKAGRQEIKKEGRKERNHK